MVAWWRYLLTSEVKPSLNLHSGWRPNAEWKLRDLRAMTTDDCVLKSLTWNTAQTLKQRHAVRRHALLELEPSAAFLNTICSSTSTVATSRCSFSPRFTRRRPVVKQLTGRAELRLVWWLGLYLWLQVMYKYTRLWIKRFPQPVAVFLQVLEKLQRLIHFNKEKEKLPPVMRPVSLQCLPVELQQ